MRLAIPGQLKINERVMMGHLGYHAHLDRRSRDASYVRRLRGLDYPRFHIYIDHFENQTVFNIHFDEKKPSYAGSARHSGQYDSELVQQEAVRIQSFLNTL